MYDSGVGSAASPPPAQPRAPTVEEIPDEGSPIANRFRLPAQTQSPKPPPVIDLRIPSPSQNPDLGYSPSHMSTGHLYEDREQDEAEQRETLHGNQFIEVPPIRPFTSHPNANIDEVLSNSTSSQELLERTQRRALASSKSALRRGNGAPPANPNGSVPPSSFRYTAANPDDASDLSKGPLHVANPDPEKRPKGLVRFRLAGLVVKGVRRFSQGPASALTRSASILSTKSTSSKQQAESYRPVDIDALHAGPGGLFEPDPDNPLRRMMTQRRAQRARESGYEREVDPGGEPPESQPLPAASPAEVQEPQPQPVADPIPIPTQVIDERTVRPGEDDEEYAPPEPPRVEEPTPKARHKKRVRSYRAYRRASYLPVKRKPRSNSVIPPPTENPEPEAVISEPVTMADPAAYPSQFPPPSGPVSRFQREPVGWEAYEEEKAPPPIKSRFGPIGRFLKAAWALPWRSKDHVTATYIPGKVRRGEVELGEPWYRGKPNRESPDSFTDSKAYAPSDTNPLPTARSVSVSRPQTQTSRLQSTRIRPAYQTSIPRPPPHRQMSAVSRALSPNQSSGSSYSRSPSRSPPHSYSHSQSHSRYAQHPHQNVDPNLPIQVFAEGQVPLHVAPPAAVPINVSGPPISGQSPPPPVSWLSEGGVPAKVVVLPAGSGSKSSYSGHSTRRRHMDKVTA